LSTGWALGWVLGWRVNFVGHGTDFNQEGAQSLADKAKILQQTYGNTTNTNIGRIALVGCGTVAW
jgi:hypothetical protein